MFGSFPPSPLVGLRLQSLLGPGSRHCYGIITLIAQESERQISFRFAGVGRVVGDIHPLRAGSRLISTVAESVCNQLRVHSLELMSLAHGSYRQRVRRIASAAHVFTWYR
jgi:hypothetical protein